MTGENEPPKPPSRSKPPSKPGIPTRQHAPKSAKKTGTMTLEEFVNQNPNLTDLEKLDIALQIAEITRKTHESGNCNLNFSLGNFQAKRTGENGEKIDISVLPGFRIEMKKINTDLGGVQCTISRTDPNPNTTPPELRNLTDTPLEGLATPRSDIWRMGQAFKAIGLPDDLRNWISKDKSEDRPDLNEKIIPGLKSAIEHIKNSSKEAETQTDEIVATRLPSQPLDLTGYTIKIMSEYDPHNIPDKNTIYFSESGDFKIFETGNPSAIHEGAIDLKSPSTQFLKQQLDGQERHASTFKQSIKNMILEELFPSKEVSIQEEAVENAFYDDSDEGGTEIPFRSYEEDSISTLQLVPEIQDTPKPKFTEEEIKQTFEIPLSEYTFKEVPKEKFKLEVGDIYLDIRGNYAFLDPDNPKKIHRGNCKDILNPYLLGLSKDDKNEKFNEILEQPLESEFRKEFQAMILNKISPPKKVGVQEEMEIDYDNEPVSREEYRVKPVAFQDQRNFALHLIVSPLMSDAMRDYRDQIFASHLGNLPHELHKLSEDLTKAKSYKDPNDPALLELRMKLEMDPLYWERAIEIQNKKATHAFDDKTNTLHQLVELDKIIKSYNQLIIDDKAGKIQTLKDLGDRIEAIHKNINNALDTRYFKPNNNNRNQLVTIQEKLSKSRMQLKKIENFANNNKSNSASERHASIRSLSNVLKSIRNFVIEGIGSLVNTNRRAPRL